MFTALHCKPLYNIKRSEKLGKNVQAAAYNGARTVDNIRVISTQIKT